MCTYWGLCHTAYSCYAFVHSFLHTFDITWSLDPELKKKNERNYHRNQLRHKIQQEEWLPRICYDSIGFARIFLAACFVCKLYKSRVWLNPVTLDLWSSCSCWESCSLLIVEFSDSTACFHLHEAYASSSMTLQICYNIKDVYTRMFIQFYFY